MIFSQYGNLFVLLLETLLLAPAIICNRFKHARKYYGMLISIPMFILLFGIHSLKIIEFVVFVVCECILVFLFLFIWTKYKKNWIYYFAILSSIFPLFIVKGCVYTEHNALGFMGISYISFRIWQIIIEIHDGTIEKIAFWDLLYFITFFPTLSSGPIDRYHRFLDEVNQAIPYDVYWQDYIKPGMKKLGYGILYKYGIAALIQYYIISQLPEKHTLLSTIIYMYAYTLYLFFDFAGYSFFAIGSGYILGIHVPENFNKPFLAHNMKEFWERWHMSLSQWFGDYIYKRFVLNLLRNHIVKSRKTAARLGNMITMLVMGIWHGFYLYYVIYGLYEGLMLVLTDVYTKGKVYRKFKTSKGYDIVSRIICFHVAAFGMLIFSGYLFSF